MHPYTLSHLSDRVLLRDLAGLVARDRTITAALLAHLAEVDERRLYLPAGFPSMYLYCIHELHLSEEAAYKRIQAARAARQFPVIFEALAEGRLHLSAVVMLAPHLTPETADELLAAATHKTKSEIEQLLAQRFPRPDAPTRVQAISPPSPGLQLSPEAVERLTEQRAPGRVEAFVPRPRVTPLSPQRFALQLTMGQRMHEKLRYAQELLGHQIPSGDVAAVLERALDALILELEQRKFAATEKPRRGQRRANPRSRHIPASIKRAVWKRDQGQCTFVSAAGRRCPARCRLEFDHIDPVARGGEATASRMRLRCRAHNQYGAECTFGTEFMRHKREAARRAAEARAAEKARAAEARAAEKARAAEARAAEKAQAAAEARAQATAAAEAAKERDVVPWLRALGFRGRRAPSGRALREHTRRAARAASAPRAVMRSSQRHSLRRAPGRERPGDGNLTHRRVTSGDASGHHDQEGSGPLYWVPAQSCSSTHNKDESPQ